jgi:hypothetical protein
MTSPSAVGRGRQQVLVELVCSARVLPVIILERLEERLRYHE